MVDALGVENIIMYKFKKESCGKKMWLNFEDFLTKIWFTTGKYVTSIRRKNADEDISKITFKKKMFTAENVFDYLSFFFLSFANVLFFLLYLFVIRFHLENIMNSHQISIMQINI